MVVFRFPWIARTFPEVRYIFWVRNPRDCILGKYTFDFFKPDLIEHGYE